MYKFAKVKSIIPINNVLTIYEIKKKKSKIGLPYMKKDKVIEQKTDQ